MKEIKIANNITVSFSKMDSMVTVLIFTNG